MVITMSIRWQHIYTKLNVVILQDHGLVTRLFFFFFFFFFGGGGGGGVVVSFNHNIMLFLVCSHTDIQTTL